LGATIGHVRIELPVAVVGDGFVLRPLMAKDAASFAAAFQEDPELGRLLGTEQDPDEQSIRARASRAYEQAASGAVVDLAIADSASDDFLGSVLLHSFD
jgi:hypothetical protein